MGINLDYLKQTIEQLERQRSLIDSALQALRALGPAANTHVTAEKPRKANGKLSGFFCSKHPDASEFSKRGQCKLCRSEFMKNYWRKRKQKQKANSARNAREAAASPVRPPSVNVHNDAKYVYSQRQRCPKCGSATRFFRPADAKSNDNWICMETGCELKVANYRILIDRGYQGDNSSAVAASA